MDICTRMFRYKYTPLNTSNEIRLVTILPGKSYDPIRIRITHAALVQPAEKPKANRLSLEEIQNTLPKGWCAKETLEGRILFFNAHEETSSWIHPDPDFPRHAYDAACQEPNHSELSYEALSYTWGPPRIRAKAFVVESDDDTKCWRARLRHLPLQRELLLAIRDLRYEDRSRAMWIDALCINQADYEERNVQVRRMGHIYSLARRVVVWLWGFPGHTEVISILRRIGEQIEIGRDQSIMPSPDCEERDWYKPDTILPWEMEDWEEVEDLCRQHWFERVWIVQEIQLGNTSSILLCGRDELLWTTFRRALLNLNRKEEMLPRRNMKSPLELCTIMEYPSLEQLLFSSRDRKCADKRDKVYGILSLAPPEIAKRIEVDYRQSVLGVYEQVFLTCLEQTQRLTQLRYSGLHHKATPGRPTWVPDWSEIDVTIQPTECFRASGISASQTRCYWPGQLEVTALRFAAVSWADWRIYYPNYEHFFGVYWGFVSLEKEVYPTGEAFREVLIQILTLNMLDDRTPGWNYPTLKEMSKMVALSKTDATRDSEKEMVQSDAWRQLTDRYRYLVLDAFSKCTIFGTENGYAGMIRGASQEDDEVFVVLGVDVPLLLRPTPTGQYEVVGDCYVHGIMDGEALLGPLPSPWTCQIGRDADGDIRPYYLNLEDGRRSADDPRLESIPLPPEWEPIERPKSRSDPEFCRMFQSKETGEIINSDPRLFPEALRARGIPLETITLV